MHITGDRFWAIVDPDSQVQSCLMSMNNEKGWMPMIAFELEAVAPMKKAAEILAKKFELDLRLVTYKIEALETEAIRVR